ncbi:hypothetical protein J2848_005216 [Azospirillum lipoferum]|uniref:Type I-E CRISPR-associated protein Cse2/CasB n=1 Tax=Azospirillum lipoferum TaxID=193 RepID=A0A5A9GF01_AZOLI|nr:MULTISPECIES: type I-E CRISPR-associated protein Cse2/CasB [Azospirillum]KAA0593118.1 hypothetical protein FZ942_24570 [Azospirillum lipoferum]MCP1613520.1 hypothetical protein [Azospirillum lipoferum]MDW5532289.1 type I-E CRISPR-associated protein Cse2/CasB [Azospirillum sp. NL1]
MNLPWDDQFNTGVLLWHQWLTGKAPKMPEGTESPPKPGLPKDNGAWPAMARCRTVADALLAPPFAQFVRYLLPNEDQRKAYVTSERNLAALARAAIAVGQLETADLTRSFAVQMGSEKDSGSGRPLVSRAVAHGLLSTANPDEALYHVIQVVGIFGKQGGNAVDLARAMMTWPSARSDWAYRYNDAVLSLSKPSAVK